MKISDLTPQEKMLLFMIRLSDALPPPRVKPDIEVVTDSRKEAKNEDHT